MTAAWPFGTDEHDPLTPSKVTTQLTDWLGGNLAALLTSEQQQRDAYRIVQQIADREGSAIARAWMIGMNPHLDEGRGRDTEAAAHAYLNGPWT